MCHKYFNASFLRDALEAKDKHSVVRGVLLPVSLADNPGGDGAQGLSPEETGLVSLL